jgi:hypothetical protein
MDVEIDMTPVDRDDFKMICEQCGSLTVTMPLEALPAPQSILNCGRCGAPRGTLQSLRKRSTQVGLKHPGL